MEEAAAAACGGGVEVVLGVLTPLNVSASLGRSWTEVSTCIPPLTFAEEAGEEGGCTMTLFNSFKSKMRVPRVDQLEGL